MTSALASYGTLFYSPFVLAPIIENFYSHSRTIPKNFLLSYLVLPITLNRESRDFLVKATSRSSLRTFSEERVRLYGLAERVQRFRTLTNTCLQLCIDTRGLKIEDDLSITKLAHNLTNSAAPKGSIKAAVRLAKLLDPYDVPAIYRFLGVEAL
jgi:hypothetical protein